MKALALLVALSLAGCVQDSDTNAITCEDRSAGGDGLPELPAPGGPGGDAAGYRPLDKSDSCSVELAALPDRRGSCSVEWDPVRCITRIGDWPADGECLTSWTGPGTYKSLASLQLACEEANKVGVNTQAWACKYCEWDDAVEVPIEPGKITHTCTGVATCTRSEDSQKAECRYMAQPVPDAPSDAAAKQQAIDGCGRWWRFQRGGTWACAGPGIVCMKAN